MVIRYMVISFLIENYIYFSILSYRFIKECTVSFIVLNFYAWNDET
jgi:hypothetical protein